ncbi:MAG: hypothetical protein IV097_15390 [Burkholderiaceae bacterium]|nr:hypothetical protein [Burkholderiaceae bacterium]
MSHIDPTGALASLLRSQVRLLNRAPGQKATRKAEASVGSPAQHAAPEPDLAALLASRLKALDPDDPNRRGKALRLFIEHTLLAEFGSNLLSDPGFFRMVDQVVAQMASAADLSLHIDQAVELLLDAR